MTTKSALLSLLLLPLVSLCARAADEPAKETLPQGAQLAALEVSPAQIDLNGKLDYRQLLVTGVLASGERLDVTRAVQFAPPEGVATVSPRGFVLPVADGAGELKITLADKSVAVPVKVAGQQEKPRASFVADVMPAMSKLGCNAGTCHGAQAGKNGFKLSLRGYDPLYDHRALIDDLAGRRFNRAAPDQSLMLLKPAGGVPHVGGVLTQPGERYYEIIRQWIADGSQLDLKTPRVAGIELFPQKPIMPLPGMKQQMQVIATYTDGAKRDVTAEAFIDTNLAEIVETDKAGLATAVRRGEAAILARYEGAYAATTVTVMGDRSGYQWQDVPENNFIDTLAYKKLREVKILPSGLCTDAEFIRRVYLDLAGVPPTPEAVRAFLDDPRPTREKRDELIDKLVGGPEYVEKWTNKWADLLQVNRKFLGEEGAWAFRNWIRAAVAGNMPYDKFAYEVLTASGSNLENPPAAYYKVLRTPEDTVENTTQLFLGIRFNCNKCHDHPFERWTQNQYYETAAYFARVNRKESPQHRGQLLGGTDVEGGKPLVEIMYDETGGEVTHVRTGQVTAPHFPFAHSGAVPADASRREQLARWITAKENPYFAKSYVNRLWSYLLGPGIIDPIDDIRAGNPASNAELLDRLTQEFIDSGFDSQHVLKLICKSRVYQHSIETNVWNEDDKINFSHALPRRLSAETLYDAIYLSTGSQPRLPGLPQGFRAAQLPDSSAQLPDGFFNLFGKPPRESACECERTSDVSLAPVLNLITGPTVADAIGDPGNRITRLEREIADDKKLVEEIFLAIYCRLPTEREIEFSADALRNFYAEETAFLQAAVAEYERDVLPKRFEEWAAAAGQETNWTTIAPQAARSAGGATMTVQPDGTILVGGTNPATDTYTLDAKLELKGVTGFRLELLPDDSLAAKGPGRAPNGNLVLNQFLVSAAPAGKPAFDVKLQNASATFSQDGYPVTNVLGALNPQGGWAVAPQFGVAHRAVFETVEDLGDGMTSLTFTLPQNFGGQHTLGKLRLSATSSPRPIRVGGSMLPQPVADILAVEAGQRTPEQQAALLKYYRETLDTELVARQKALDEHLAKSAQARLLGAQDLTWALINSPAFLFNR